MDHALIVIDLIEDYFDAGIWPYSVIPSKRDEIVRATNALVRLCRRGDVPVIWVRQEFKLDFSDAFPHARRQGMRYAIAGTPGAAFLKDLDVRSGDSFVEKTRFSAFFGTDLDGLLEELGTSVVILAGITTAWCVRSTAVDAYQRDYEVVLASDCMAAFDDQTHVESLKAMDGYIATCMTKASLASHLDSERARRGLHGLAE